MITTPSGVQDFVLGSVRNGFGPVGGATEFAESRLEAHGSVERAIDAVIAESMRGAGAKGFLTGLGGLPAMPITIPAGMALAWLNNARMVGAVAHLRGYDLQDARTEAVLMMVLAGSTTNQIGTMIGMGVGAGLTRAAIAAIPVILARDLRARAAILIARYLIGGRLAGFGARAIPLIGGVVGGVLDATWTGGLGAVARASFPTQ